MRLFHYIALIVLCASVAYAAPETKTTAPNEASLISIWEATQKNDPQTIIFQKVANKKYHFKTERFPFDGNILLLKATIAAPDTYDTMTMGYVEVDLAGVDDAFFRKYGHSYSLWQQTNSFFFNTKTQAWAPLHEWNAQYDEEMENSCATTPWYYLWGDTLFWILGLLLFIVILLGITRKQTRQVKKSLDSQDQALEMMRQSMTMQEKSMEISQQMLQELKKLNRKE